MTPTRSIPHRQLRDEARALGAFMETPPWLRPRAASADGAPGADVDRGVRAAFKRWTVADAEPSTEMLAAVWPRAARLLAGLGEAEREAAVGRIARVLHLVALGAETGPKARSFGASCRAAGVAEGRFARLVNAPTPARLEALGRAFRRFRVEGVRVSPDDAEHLLRFLFTHDGRASAAHWAAGFFGGEAAGAAPDDAVADAVSADFTT